MVLAVALQSIRFLLKTTNLQLPSCQDTAAVPRALVGKEIMEEKVLTTRGMSGTTFLS